MHTSSAKDYTQAPEPDFWRNYFNRFIKFWFYPLGLLMTLAFIYMNTMKMLGAPKQAYAIYLGSDHRHHAFSGMGHASTGRLEHELAQFLYAETLPMMLVNGAALAATSFCLTALAVLGCLAQVSRRRRAALVGTGLHRYFNF